METFVSERREAIDWVQEQLGSTNRIFAEDAYFGLVERGMIVEADNIHTPIPLSAEAIMQVAKQEAILGTNSQSRIRRRHNSQTYRKLKTRHVLQQGNTIDCAADDVWQ